MQLTPQRRKVLTTIITIVLLAAVWWIQNNDTAPSQDRARDTSTSSPQSPQSTGSPGSSGTDPDSGLPIVQVGDLPPEVGETLALIDAGGPYPHDEDDGTFGNFEGILPDQDRGYYREYTVETPGLSHRGARRIVTGSNGEFYWTDDHYSSFSRIDR